MTQCSDCGKRIGVLSQKLPFEGGILCGACYTRRKWTTLDETVSRVSLKWETINDHISEYLSDKDLEFTLCAVDTYEYKYLRVMLEPRSLHVLRVFLNRFTGEEKVWMGVVKDVIKRESEESARRWFNARLPGFPIDDSVQLTRLVKNIHAYLDDVEDIYKSIGREGVETSYPELLSAMADAAKDRARSLMSGELGEEATPENAIKELIRLGCPSSYSYKAVSRLLKVFAIRYRRKKLEMLILGIEKYRRDKAEGRRRTEKEKRREEEEEREREEEEKMRAAFDDTFPAYLSGQDLEFMECMVQAYREGDFYDMIELHSLEGMREELSESVDELRTRYVPGFSGQEKEDIIQQRKLGERMLAYVYDAEGIYDELKAKGATFDYYDLLRALADAAQGQISEEYCQRLEPIRDRIAEKLGKVELTSERVVKEYIGLDDTSDYSYGAINSLLDLFGLETPENLREVIAVTRAERRRATITQEYVTRYLSKKELEFLACIRLTHQHSHFRDAIEDHTLEELRASLSSFLQQNQSAERYGPSASEIDYLIKRKSVLKNISTYLDDAEKIYKLILRRGGETDYHDILSGLADTAQKRIEEEYEGALTPARELITKELGDKVTVETVIRESIRLGFIPYYSEELVSRLLDMFGLPYDRDRLESLISEIKEDVELEEFENKMTTQEGIDLGDYRHLKGHEFESYLSSLFEHLGYTVLQTPVSADQGADLIISLDEEKTVVQAKKQTKNVANRAVQEVVAAKKYYKADSALVVTNSSFTQSAIDLALANEVALWDGTKLEDTIRSLRKRGERPTEIRKLLRLSRMEDLYSAESVCPWCSED